MPRWIGVLLAITLVVSCGGGGGGGNGNGTPPNVAGGWAGSWSSSVFATGGSLGASLSQNGENFSGSVTLGNSPCFSDGSISGIVTGSGRFVGTARFPGGAEIDLDGNASSSQISGGYAVFGSSCDGDRGTFALGR